MTAPLRWTVRAERRAGNIRSELDSRYGPPPRGTRRLTIWIHGFNTSEYDAADTWDLSHQRVREITSLARLNGTVWFFWPGDGSRNKILSAASYFAQIPDAIRAGHLLAQHITELSSDNPRLEVDLVAHSLGCRVALEAARKLTGIKGSPQIRNLLLFAAAVPEGLFLTGNQYEHHVAKREQVVFSSSDSVLRTWFPIGQAIACRLGKDVDPGDWKKAVGYAGGPPSRWSWTQEADGYEHGDYWTKNESLILIGSLYGRVQSVRNPTIRHMKERRMARRIQKER